MDRVRQLELALAILAALHAEIGRLEGKLHPTPEEEKRLKTLKDAVELVLRREGWE